MAQHSPYRRNTRQSRSQNFRFVTKDEAEKLRQAKSRAAAASSSTNQTSASSATTTRTRTTKKSPSSRSKKKTSKGSPKRRKNQQPSSSSSNSPNRSRKNKSPQNQRTRRTRKGTNNNRSSKGNSQWKRKEKIDIISNIPSEVLFTDLTYRSNGVVSSGVANGNGNGNGNDNDDDENSGNNVIESATEQEVIVKEIPNNVPVPVEFNSRKFWTNTVNFDELSDPE